jgi:putative cardiolipin synthase
LKVLNTVVLAAFLLVTGCASLPVDYERTESYAQQDTGATRLAQATQGALRAHAGQNGFRPLADGTDALLARIYLAESAERSLDLMYFVWQNDRVGRYLADALLRAADRGVRVRLLLDDIGSHLDDDTLMALGGHPNIEVRLFNPVASRSFRRLSMLTDFQRINRRMHNKAFVADNQRAILGGRNVGAEYFDAHDDWNFEDLDVLTAGPVVGEVSAVFDLYWNAPMVYPISALTGRRHDIASLDALRARLAGFVASQRDGPYSDIARARAAEVLSSDGKEVFWGVAHVLFDHPSKVTQTRNITEGHLLPQFAALGLPLEKELTIVSPYFIPGNPGVDWLTGLARQGVKVTVLTNSLASTNVAMVHGAYKRYRGTLLEGGIVLYELRPDAFKVGRDSEDGEAPDSTEAALHAKTFFIDRREVFIGSLNLDPRSIQLNTEIGVVCESAAMTEALLGRLEPRLDRIAWRLERVVDDSKASRIAWLETGERGVQQRFEEPEVSTWRRLQVWFFGLLPIDSQL